MNDVIEQTHVDKFSMKKEGYVSSQRSQECEVSIAGRQTKNRAIRGDFEVCY